MTENNQENTGTLYCLRHPRTETRLRCASCGVPICVRCMVQTEVGMKCPDCVRKLKTHLEVVSPLQYVFAFIAGSCISLVGVLIISFLFPMGGFLVGILGGMALGYGVSQGIFYSSGRKLGIRMQIVAGISLLLPFILVGFVTFWAFSLVYWLALVVSVISAVYYLK